MSLRAGRSIPLNWFDQMVTDESFSPRTLIARYLSGLG